MICIDMRRAVGLVGRQQSASGQKYSWLVIWEKPMEVWCKVTDEIAAIAWALNNSRASGQHLQDDSSGVGTRRASFGSPFKASEVQLDSQPHWEAVWLSVSVQPKSILITLLSQKSTGAFSSKITLLFDPPMTLFGPKLVTGAAISDCLIPIIGMDKHQEYERVFNHFDENKDGKISPAELQQCVKAIGGELSREEAEVAVEVLDTDGDGLLGLEDFIRLVEEVGEEEKVNDLKEAFKMYEMEGCGCITPKSLKRMLSRLGESRTLEECKSMIAQFDLNGDGVLNFDEFRVMML
ncbi:hypothetical protein GOBAR_AA17567 [Gossypium barbadense]|uniref:EF-hand domain-containing protein n=8 Tax=Gossypium TaxID=3633 RepID=A0A2P5XIA6_GOSBA|nr:hypothetical protein GOBAR_AA17567 [Gossypium barbadense]